MYTVGEFAKVAQVSKRLLRYYDQLGLLNPEKVDKFTGYRYYSVSQLPVLNRIIALKEMGLSLEQIQRLIVDNISLDEISGMLLMKKIEIEQELLDGVRQIRTIESRLRQIQEQEQHVRDVVIKQIPTQYLLGVRRTYPTFEAGAHFFESLFGALPAPNNTIYSHFTGIIHADGLDDNVIDLEAGRLLHQPNHEAIITNDDVTLTVREVPAVETMATFIQHGISEEAHIGFSAIGAWVEANNYQFAGAVREVLLEIPQHPDETDMVLEIQFPIEKATNPPNLLTLLDS